MQEDCKDYSDREKGCCLNCEDAEPGCLCYSCKCTKCFHYTKISRDEGRCDIAHQTKLEVERKKAYWKGKNKVIDYSRLGLPDSQTQLKEVW